MAEDSPHGEASERKTEESLSDYVDANVQFGDNLGDRRNQRDTDETGWTVEPEPTSSQNLQDGSDQSESEDVLTSFEETVLPGLKQALRKVSALGVSSFSVGYRRLIRILRGESDPHEGLSGAYYPQEAIRDDEEVKWAIVPSRWTALGPYSLAGLFFFAAVFIHYGVKSGLIQDYLNIRSPSFILVSFPDWVPVVVPVFFICVGILTAIGEYVNRASTWYLLTDRRLIYRLGPFESSVRQLPISSVNSADYTKPIPIRFIGLGHVAVYTASTDGAEVVFRSIQAPHDRVNTLAQQQAYLMGHSENETSQILTENEDDEENEKRGLFGLFG